MHEHHHGDENNILVTTTGLVVHSISDGLAQGASMYCKHLSSSLIFMYSEL